MAHSEENMDWILDNYNDAKAYIDGCKKRQICSRDEHKYYREQILVELMNCWSRYAADTVDNIKEIISILSWNEKANNGDNLYK